MFSFKNATVLAALLLAVQTPILRAQDAPLSPPVQSAISDLLIVLDSDGRSHTAQHTVSTNSPALTLTLPGSIIPQDIGFLGSARNAAIELNKNQPNVIALQSGSAYVRYQHQYGREVQQVQSDHFELSVQSIPENIELSNTGFIRISTTWIFPDDFEIISYSADNPHVGQWASFDNTLSFNQTAQTSVQLFINFKAKTPSHQALLPTCANNETDDCMKDADKDGVPDERDICLSDNTSNINAYGCESGQNMLLSSVVFDVGRTYLDANARQMLDTVAQALLHNENGYFEIGAHTDNAGATFNNQQLSKKRATAVRHYLILKGVDPNAITAVGYGENYPIRDNSNSDGRRANRRIELSIRQ